MTLGGLGWQFTQKSLVAYVARQHTEPLNSQQVQLIDMPTWMSPLLQAQLQSLIVRELALSPMNGSSLESTVDLLAANPWVEQVHRLSRTSDGQIWVAATYREPVAMVRSAGAYHLIDNHCRRLPGRYSQKQMIQVGLPLIEGVGEKLPGVGEIWRSDSLQSGLSLAHLVDHQPYTDQIRAIDVSQRDRRGRLRMQLVTHRGGQVRWGRAPGRGYPIESTDEVKLQSLQSLFERCGQIDAGGKKVDVFSKTVLIHQPVQVQTALAR